MFKTLSVSRVAIAAACTAVTLTVGTATADAATLGFSCVTNNTAANCAIGTAQLTVELVDLGNGTVEFLFRNTGANGGAITQIYFDQVGPSLMALSSMTGSNGVDFRQQGLGFAAHGAGAGSGDWLRLAFTLSQGSTFASLLTSLTTGDLRIGMHVQALGANGQSEAFVNQAVTPEPTSLLLLGTGLAAAAARRRQLRNRRATQP